MDDGIADGEIKDEFYEENGWVLWGIEDYDDISDGLLKILFGN
jgi:hypothetical protein